MLLLHIIKSCDEFLPLYIAFYDMQTFKKIKAMRKNSLPLIYKHHKDVIDAEGMGFEPTDAYTSFVFEATALDRSATLPYSFLPRKNNNSFSIYCQ